MRTVTTTPEAGLPNLPHLPRQLQEIDMRGNIHFPGRGIGHTDLKGLGHMDLAGEIPTGPARLFGIMEMPALGNMGCPGMFGDIPIGT